ncbi:acyloxyacyl hydrolase, partial [Candidatus Pelagibacter sp.]|nr:acyloxyacyl hydrolase [Candidatus Pelagibacter sp.]
MSFKKLSIFLVILFTTTKLFAVEISSHQYNFFVGNFDFSDKKQAATLFGFQHQNEDLERDTFLGNISPITGGFITE